MINISDIKTRLTRLCDGNYSREDVDYIVELLRAEAEEYLAAHLFHLQNSQSAEAYRKSPTEHAYDFIGPLLGRNSGGRFYILDDYFSKYKTAADADYLTAFKRFIYTRFHTELIREIEDSDGFSKALHRTLYYLLKKHPDWIKTEIPGQSRILKRKTQSGLPATIDDYHEAYNALKQKAFSKYIEA